MNNEVRGSSPTRDGRTHDGRLFLQFFNLLGQCCGSICHSIGYIGLRPYYVVYDVVYILSRSYMYIDEMVFSNGHTSIRVVVSVPICLYYDDACRQMFGCFV